MTPEFSIQTDASLPQLAASSELKSESVASSISRSEIILSQESLKNIDISTLHNFQLVMIERDSFVLDKMLAKTTQLNLGKSKSATIRIENAESDLRKILPHFRFETQDSFDTLLKELTWQAKIFGGIKSLEKTRVSIDFVLPIKNPPKNPLEGFHVDATPSRCLCTLVGAGTEWAQESSLKDDLRNCQSISERARVIDKMNWLSLGSQIQKIPTGAIAITKANEWVHRRPWVNEGRLFVTMDPS